MKKSRINNKKGEGWGENRYDHQAVEKKWRDLWQRVSLNVTDISGARKPFDKTQGKPFYNLMMFPYPSAEGLHVGNMYAFTGSDIYGRYKRMQGYEVFEPIGLDGFGIHSENFAFKIGKHPMDQAKVSQERYYEQLHIIGAMYDWSRTVETYDPDYYRYTQWIFVQMFKHGLAFREKAQVNWCPSCKTVLADEQVVEGKCERCGNLVSNRLLEQWFFKITAYAEKLLNNLASLDWDKKVKIAQERWIGKKEGYKILFDEIEVFTTRPDTIFGATFVVLSPGHPLAGKVKKVINPATKKVIPVFVDEYVLKGVGTGAIMGVPAYDDRDMAFAKKMNLPVIRAKLTDKVFGKKMTTYRLRDWLISRQRYWGPPIPMIFCQSCKENGRGEQKSMLGWWPVPEKDLPVVLPRIEDYKPGDDGLAPLAKHTEFCHLACPQCGSDARRETDVSDTFLDSSWYFLRYPSISNVIANPEGVKQSQNYQIASSKTPRNDKQQLPWDQQITKKWLPVHMYTGGAEHSVLHLLYSRFVTMALKDMGYIDFEEPFTRFYAHGLIIKDGAKMSKSKGNIVNPDEYIERYGVDALRLYLMFTGPFDQGGDFRDSAMEGMSRWVNRVWRMAAYSILNFKNRAVAKGAMARRRQKLKSNNNPKDVEQRSSTSSAKVQTALQRLIKKVGDDIERRRYNTAIASMMEFTNLVADENGALSLDDLKTFLKLLAPFAPYLAEELWFRCNTSGQSVHLERWPTFDTSAVKEENVTIIVQVNGKHRDTLELRAQSSGFRAEVEAAARSSEKVKKYLAGMVVKNVVFVPARLINFVI